jgi:hypothetical protein
MQGAAAAENLALFEKLKVRGGFSGDDRAELLKVDRCADAAGWNAARRRADGGRRERYGIAILDWSVSAKAVGAGPKDASAMPSGYSRIQPSRQLPLLSFSLEFFVLLLGSVSQLLGFLGDDGFGLC